MSTMIAVVLNYSNFSISMKEAVNTAIFEHLTSFFKCPLVATMLHIFGLERPKSPGDGTDTVWDLYENFNKCSFAC